MMLTLSDDGVGFDTSLASDGQGLTSMRRRAQRLKGTLEIASGGGSGTIGHARASPIVTAARNSDQPA